MQLSKDDLAALSGQIFTSSYRFKPKMDALDKTYLTRTALLRNLCEQKNIIHLGCVDHSAEIIEKKLARGKWLHKHLDETANRCLGIDLNKEGLDYIRDKHGFQDLLCTNIIEEECREILDHQWDYFLIPEVLEHQDNPVWFLSEIRKKYQTNVKNFVITVPNAFDLGLKSHLMKNLEPVNSDHRFWFTPYTLAKVLYAAGFTNQTLRLCRNGVIKKRNILKNYILKTHPFLRNNIVAIVA